MSRPTCSDTYPPRVDFTKTPLAYGLRAVPRILRELVVDEVVVRRRALNSLAVYLVNPLHVQESLDRGVMRVLYERLKETDYLVRERTTACLQLFSRSTRGCEAILLDDIVNILRKRIDDIEEPVRINSYNTFLNLSGELKGAFEITNYDLVSIFVEKLWTEIPIVKKVLLSILHHIMEYADIRRDVLTTPAMIYFTSYLQSEDVEIREGAARCTGDLAVEILGKTQANGCGTVEILTDLIMKEPMDLPTMAPISYALMMCLIDIEARYRALKRSGEILGRVITLARHPALEVALNAIKIATIMAESPEGRKYYMENFAAVADFQKLPDPDLKRVAETLVAVIMSKP
ncbi:putative Radial spoke head 14-like protein [Hypsibius exemplaris]|uniref:Radial spoke head 14-like protein n=1 Tax=Hypsibius exemplaris TaxID=2072580 RepID=A0A9X6RKU5_HYPEX|nr:putative Radial spoke head 14-like protein [Hypsibius exemplaris]